MGEYTIKGALLAYYCMMTGSLIITILHDKTIKLYQMAKNRGVFLLRNKPLSLYPFYALHKRYGFGAFDIRFQNLDIYLCMLDIVKN